MQDGFSNPKDKKQNVGKVFVKCSVNTKTQKAEKEVRLGVLGASGYTGSEVVAHWQTPLFTISYFNSEQ